MKRRPLHTFSIGVSIAALIAMGSVAASQTRTTAEPQAFLHIPEIPGTSPVTPYAGWIEIGGLSPLPSAASPSHDEFRFTKLLDKTSAKLLDAFKRGTRFGTVRVAVRGERDSPQDDLIFTFADARITKHKVEHQVEYISFTYEKILRPKKPELPRRDK
jgi:type VI protein secretion system component Hcp